MVTPWVSALCFSRFAINQPTSMLPFNRSDWSGWRLLGFLRLIAHLHILTPYALQTVYLLLVERSGGEKGLSSTELMLYNAVLSLPFLVFVVLVTGEFKTALPLLLDKVRDVECTAIADNYWLLFRSTSIPTWVLNLFHNTSSVFRHRRRQRFLPLSLPHSSWVWCSTSPCFCAP